MKQNYIFIMLLIFISSNMSSQSKLKKAQESLKKQEQNIRINEDENDYGNTKDDAPSFFEETIGQLFVNIFAYSVYGVLIESPFENNSKSTHAILTKQPYLNSNAGNYDYDWNNNSAIGRTTLSSRFIFENPTLKGNHFNIDMRFYNKLALDINYLQLWENNPNFGYQTLAIYSALAKYHRIRTTQLDVWWGLGATYVDGNVDNFGFTYGLGAELFVVNPISIEVNFNQTLINDNTINKLNGLINYYFKCYKLNAGYEHLKIGSQNFSTASIGFGVSF